MTTAPQAPGAMGVALDPRDTQTYLTALEEWIRTRRTELDEIDAAALGAGRGQEITSDMMLSLALWKAVSERYQLLLVTFDGGRVTGIEQQRLSSLVWGRMDGTLDPSLLAKAVVGSDPTGSTTDMGGVAVSLPEACRLSDALAGQLQVRLALVPGADASAARIKALRATLERVRDQVALEPATTRQARDETFEGLLGRLADTTKRAERGADVGGLLGPLEIEAAQFERDLIVGNAQRREARGLVVAARQLRTDLEARSAALTALAAKCVKTVDPAPRYAVPDVDLLGPVPNTVAAIGDYRARLDRVARAMNIAQTAYAGALAEHSQLVDLLGVLRAKADALGVAGAADLAASETQARAVLAREPAPMSVARAMVSTYQTWLAQLSRTKESA